MRSLSRVELAKNPNMRQQILVAQAGADQLSKTGRDAGRRGVHSL
ncbi:hypothetical protein CEXT_137081, partial [Caerostris extrusa]